MEQLANILTNYCVEKNIVSYEKREIYCYGFKLIFSDIINFAIIIVLGLLTNSVIESFCFLITLCGVRIFSGGYHAYSFWVCRLSMIFTYICVKLSSYLIITYGNRLAWTVVLNMFSVGFMLAFSPIEHPNKPLNRINRRKNKIKAIITSALMSVLSLFMILADMSLGVTISITLSAVAILMIVGMIVKKGGNVNV